MTASRPAFRVPPSPDRPGDVLVLLAHPALQRSRVHRRLLQGLDGLDGVTVHDLYEAWPNHDIDPGYEQALLDAHRAVVWQFPMFWYSSPALLKDWQDLVLEFGWAYGPEGLHLRGKPLLVATSTGGRAEAYTPEGLNHYEVPELLRPMEVTAGLCGMRWLPPWVVHGAHRLDEPGLAVAAADYRETLTALRDGRIDALAAGQRQLGPGGAR